ncbi:amino acid adenylation domain-containing protein [Sorangium sp. So ce131]|uniref:amino acid adenylation domain-containing protein n=1 Tax=Sorangium sp. So ce131 TaxID=3133282 RepID=UPI003F60EFA4
MSKKPDPSANIESVYPLSPMQEGMLFHTLLRPSSGVYLMQNRYRIEGDLRRDEFVAAWRDVVARHSILRTSFVWKSQKRPLQVVHRAVELPFDVLDHRGLAGEAQEARLAAELRDELDRGLDLGKAPVMRLRLVQLDDRTFELVHSFHHILLDEWCTSSLMMDFLAHYEARVRGETPNLPPARPYRDYIDWLARQDREAAEAFWRAALKGLAAPTPLGFEERSAPAGAADAADAADHGEIADLTVRLGREPTAALRALAQRHRLTLNTIVQGAWALLLSRYSGEPEVLFGVTVAGRPPELPGVESILGLFINTLPLRVPVPAEQPLLPWLAALLEKNLGLRQHEHTPLVDVQRWSEIERGQPLFRSLFVFENAPVDPALREGRIVFRVADVRDRVHTNYPLTIMAWPDVELPLKLSYDRSRVRPELAARLLGHLRALLEGMAANPGARLGDLPLLTPAERQQALVAWNTTPAPEEDLSSYAARFRAQVARTPDAVAATCAEERRTYAALNREANRAAHALIALGVGPEQRVALLDDRGLPLLTMILAVFKAGGAYVPIDPTYPAERVAQILASSEPRVVLTRERHRGALERAFALLPEPLRPAIATLEAIEATEGAPGDAASDEDPEERGGAESLAYVIYTSGSTGVPKGAMVERRGMLNNMLSKLPRLGLAAGDVIAQTASACFDISVWQLLTALLFGGVVDIVPDEIARDPARLLEHLERRGTAVVEVVPAVLQGMLDAAREHPAPPALARLRWVLPTGEALPAALARAWLDRYPAVPLMNAYGPAECSDDVALHAIAAPPAAHEAHVPIGRPVDGLRLYVLDPLLAPAPVGVCGELYVGGVGVGRGYLGDPGRTAAAFLPDPFSQAPGRRLYRTGDLGRYRDDGTIEFVGRRDHQVKLRGYRIELGEIEARLAEHPAVQEAVVVVREDRPGVKRLVAYVAAGAPAPSGEALRAWLAARLPEYMVPTAFVLLPALPRTPNGKVDRRALPAPEAGDALDHVAPRTATEELLAGIWAEVLGVERVSVEDSFFDLGGHSLLLTQILSRVRRVLDVELPLRALFETPTVAAQARAVEAARRGPASTPAPPLVPGPRGGPLPLSFAQERLWFLAQLEETAASYNVPAAVRLLGPLDVARLERSFAAVVHRHTSLRATFVDEGGRAAVVVRDALPAAIAVVDLAGVPEASREEEARRLLEEQASRPFDLTRGPLFRIALLRLAEREHLLLVVLHHIVSDGWSMNVLVREVTELYAADAEGRAAALPSLPIQYADYARWQRAWLAGPALDQQLAYFRQRLGAEPPVLRLPADRPRPAARSYRGARLAFELSRELSEGLGALARAQGVTSFMLLLSAFQALLSGYSGQTDLCVGTPIAGRTRVEVEGLIGLFVNTLVLRADLGGDPRFTDVLARSREEVLAAQAHQDLPFERLVKALRPARDLGNTPLFQVMFSLQEAPRRALPLAGLELRHVEVDPGSAQFDLSLHMASAPEGLSGSFEYSTELFEERTIRRMADDLRALLEAIAARPTARLGELPLPALALSPTEATPRAGVALEGAPPTEAAPPIDPAPQLDESGARLDAAPDAASAAAVEAQLAEIWAAVLGRERVGRDDNFFELGGDSILSLQVVSRAKQAGLRVTARQMFQHQTLAALAAAASAASSAAAPAGEEPATGDVPLTPIQRRFFARDLPNPHHWNQALLLTIAEPLAWPALQTAVQALLAHHDALRLRYVPEGAGFRQAHAPGEIDAAVHRADLAGVPEAEQPRVLEAHAARWQASLDLTTGPLLRVVAFDLGPGRPARLLLIAHHLVVDGVSWRILLDDLQTAYDQARRGAPAQLPDRTTSFKRWAERLEAAAQDAALQEEAAFWLGLPWDRVAPLPVDDPAGDRAESTMATLKVALSGAETRSLLEAASEAYRTRVDELLLAGLALALGRWTGQRVVAVEVEGHGREGLDGEELDLSRTVGWFTTAYPVVLDVAPDAAPGAALKAVKEQLRRVPRRGLPYGAVRELGAGAIADRLRRLPAPGVGFNYLGQWDQVLGAGARFSLAAESPGPEHDPRSPLAYEIEIDAAVYDGRLDATFRYSAARYRRETVAEVGALFRDALRELIAHCLSPDAGGYTPSDFPDVALAPNELDSILERLD